MEPTTGLPTAGLRIDGRRLWSTLMEMAKIGETPQGGCDRQALTDADREGRDLFSAWAREAGCAVGVDEIGNIFATRPGGVVSASPVLVGSHLDTQGTGGRFDGVFGVLAGLEVVRTLNDHGVITRRSVEVASWTNEEGCRFAPAMLGSGVVSGAYDLAFAYDRTDRAGLRLGDELARIGYRGDRPARPRSIHAIFEAHIEQGPLLESIGATIGVVTGIQGACWLDVTLEGVAAHAGPTPMEMRRDPWRAACPIIEGTLAIAKARAPWGRATIGDVRATPGARNTVPERLILSIDLRHPDAAILDAMVEEFSEKVDIETRRCGIGQSIEHVWTMPPTAFDARLVGLVEQAARDVGYSHEVMVSGAGHDALHTAAFAPTAMIFVPCRGGVSHNAAEYAAPADLEAGANVLLQAVLTTACE